MCRAQVQALHMMMIKPDTVQEGKVEEIVEAVKSHGLEVLLSNFLPFVKGEGSSTYVHIAHLQHHGH